MILASNSTLALIIVLVIIAGIVFAGIGKNGD